MTELERQDVAIDQLSETIVYLLDCIAKQNDEKISSACQRLALNAPKRFIAQALAVNEQAFRSRGM